MAKDLRIVTPAGRMEFPYLTQPDTKFSVVGEYKVDLIVADGPETQALIAKIDNAQEEAMVEFQAELGKGKKIKDSGNRPYSEVLDAEGEPTGEVRFRVKMKAEVALKKGGTLKLSPKLVDAKKVELPNSVRIGSGSIGKVSADIHKYNIASSGVGVQLRLVGVQVLKIVAYGAGQDLFEEEDGYEYEAEAGEDSPALDQSAGESDF